MKKKFEKAENLKLHKLNSETNDSGNNKALKN